MSNKPIETFTEALRLLNPELGGQQEEPLARAWLTVFAPMSNVSDERVLETLKSPWNEIKNGVAIKVVPFIISENLCQMIEQHWGELPMYARDLLTEKSMDGHNERLRETIQRISGKEKANND